jgi:GNAT superfamily N-acetyltransferase
VRDREVSSLYVLASHHGTGIGQVLLDTVVAPRTPAQLWVAERNPRARRFYEKNGLLPDGARFVDQRLDLAEVRHVR